MFILVMESQGFVTQLKTKEENQGYMAYGLNSLYSIGLSKVLKRSTLSRQQLGLVKQRWLYNGPITLGSNKIYHRSILITKWKLMNSPKDC